MFYFSGLSFRDTQRVWVFRVRVFETPEGLSFFGVWVFETPRVWVFRVWGLSFRDTPISKSQGKWKKVQNSGVSKYPGKCKIRNKIPRTVWRKALIRQKYSNNIICWINQQMLLHWKIFECSVVFVFCFINTFVHHEWQLACSPSNLGSLNSKQTVAWESLDCLTDLALCWFLGSFFLYSVFDKFETTMNWK